MEYASFSRRAVALLIDGILLSFVSYLFSGSGFDWAGPSWGMSALPMIIGWLYFAGMESSSRRATLGKRVMEMQVVTEENDQLSFVQASIRYFSKILSALIFVHRVLYDALFRQKTDFARSNREDHGGQSLTLSWIPPFLRTSLIDGQLSLA
jgi:uncharacterized RDD family membrane protein YckC